MEILDKKSNRMSRANAGVSAFYYFATAYFINSFRFLTTLVG